MFTEHRQLTAAGFIFLRQLTAEGYYRILHVFLSQIKCVNNKFHGSMSLVNPIPHRVMLYVAGKMHESYEKK